MANDTVTFKIVLDEGGGEEAHIRRLSLASSELTLAALRQQTKQLFSLSDSAVWYFKWQDEDNDLVMITEEYELQDALNASNGKPVVRLVLVVEQPPSAEQIPIPNFWQHPRRGPHCWWSRFAGAQEPQHQQHQQQQQQQQACRDDNAASSSTTNNDNTDEPPLVAFCDHTRARLTIEQGNWYHQPSSSVDLSKEEVQRLGPDVQKNFVLVTKPEDLGAELPRYQGRRCRRPFGGCGRGGRGGGRGGPWAFGRGRGSHGPWGRHWNQFDCNEGTTNTTTSDSGAQKPQDPFAAFTGLAEGLVQGVASEVNRLAYSGACDITNRPLLPGAGWYHKMDSSYDLCEAEFNKIQDPEEKAKFVRVQTPEDLGADKSRYNNMTKLESTFGQLFGNNATPFCPTPRAAPTAETTPQVNEVTVLSGPSIAPGTAVQAGARLIPVWEVANSATQGAPWTEVRVKPVKNAPNPMLVPEEGFEVPSLAPGEKGIVTVEITVPQGLTGKTPATFQLVDGNGNTFGAPLEIVVDILPPPAAQQPTATTQSSLPPVHNEAELLSLLHDMGFADDRACIDAIRRCKGDVNAAALLLLSSSV